jgi:hypothetical protein
MNYTNEISRAGIYYVCDNTKYNSCPGLYESGPGPTFPELEFEMCTNLYIGIYIIFRGRDSPVGIAAGYGLDGPGIESR